MQCWCHSNSKNTRRTLPYYKNSTESKIHYGEKKSVRKWQNWGLGRGNPNPCLATSIALYRPQIGPLARNEKPGKRGKNGWKMGKWPFLIHFWANFPIFRPCFPLFSGLAKNHFSAIFSDFGRRSDLGLYRAIGIAILVVVERILIRIFRKRQSVHKKCVHSKMRDFLLNFY